MAELVVKVDPKIYRKSVSTDSKEHTILYVEMQKSLYGILKYALVFYLNLVGDITREVFKLNPYDSCVMNKKFGVEQMTIVFYVVNLKDLFQPQMGQFT